MSKFIVDGANSRRSQIIQTEKSVEMINAMRGFFKSTVTPFDGQFGQRAIVTIAKPKGYGTGNYVFDNADYDFEFDIPFAYNLEAKKAEIIIYNVPNHDVSIFNNTSISVSAGYGNSVSRIFSGTITSVKTKRDDLDRVTTIKAETGTIYTDVHINQTYINKCKASYILKDLIKVTKKPTYYYEIARDYTYADDETIDGALFSNIDRVAAICGAIVTYGSGIIVCPYTYFRKFGSSGTVSYANGLLDINEWSDKETNGKYVDYTRGYNVSMLLNPNVHALSVFKVNRGETQKAIDYNDKHDNAVKLIALSGSHEYDGDKMITKVKGVI